MDATRFDLFTRSLAATPSRRLLLRGVAALCLAAASVPDVASARKRKKVKFNTFGCVNVGRFCKRAGQCCSGICQGKKGKKKCKAHDGGSGCQVGDHEGFCGGADDIPCTTATGAVDGVCDTTTGNTAYCVTGFVCAECSKDVECQDLCGVAAAACIICPDCDGISQTACVGPGPEDCEI